MNLTTDYKTWQYLNLVGTDFWIFVLFTCHVVPKFAFCATSVRPSVHYQTRWSHMNYILLWIEVDETNRMIWFSRWSKVKVKVTEHLNSRKLSYSKSISFAISVARLNLIIAYDIMGQYLNFVVRFSNFCPVHLPRGPKVCILCYVRPSVRS